MKRVLAGIILAVLSTGALSAQQAQVLSFEEALQLMNHRNDRIAAADYEEESAEMQKKAAFGLRLPQIGVTGTYVYMSDDIGLNFNNLKEPIAGVVGEISTAFPELGGAIGELLQPAMQKNWEYVLQDRDFGMVGATVQMPVYMGGKINAANNAARIDWDITKEKSEQTRNELVSELAERYFGLSLANQVVEVRREVVEGMEKHLSDAKALEENGMIARVERLFAEMSVADARREWQKSIRDAATINTALGNTLNQEAVYTPLTTLFIVNDIEPVSFFKELARDRNPQLKQVDLMEQKAREGVRAQRAEFMPQVALMGGYDIYNHQLTKYAPTWVIGAGVSLKIFDGLNREYKYSAAKNQVRQVQALSAKAGSDISTLVEKIYNEMLAAGEQIESLDVALEFAGEYLDAKEKAFHEGMAPSSDVVDAQLNQAKIRTERLQAAYTYDLLLARLLEASGDSGAYSSYITGRPVTPIRFEK